MVNLLRHEFVAETNKMVVAHAKHAYFATRAIAERPLREISHRRPGHEAPFIISGQSC